MLTKLGTRLAVCSVAGVALFLVPNAEPQQRRRNQSAINYSSFSHSTHVTKEKLACGSCHKFPSKNWKEVRKGDEAFPDVVEFPEHASCLSCHRAQFFARERPAPRICSNCHVKATPTDTSRRPFPTLSKGPNFVSDFRVVVPKHDEEPSPLNHATCFTCHNQESELAPLPPNCDACHKPPTVK